MTKQEIQKILRAELPDWSYATSSFSNKKEYGRCDHTEKHIQLSWISFFSKEPKYDALHCLLHEIAHALVGENKGHGEEWKRKELELLTKYTT